jgi:hypothetical protein
MWCYGSSPVLSPFPHHIPLLSFRPEDAATREERKGDVVRWKEGTGKNWRRWEKGSVDDVGRRTGSNCLCFPCSVRLVVHSRSFLSFTTHPTSLRSFDPSFVRMSERGEPEEWTEWSEPEARVVNDMRWVSDRRAVHRSLRSLLPSRSATPAPRLFARGRRTAPLLVPRRSLITSPFGTGSARWTGAPHAVRRCLRRVVDIEWRAFP